MCCLNNSEPNGHNTQLQYVKRSVSGEQMCYNIHIGDLLTSGDLHVGHNDLGQQMLVRPYTERGKQLPTLLYYLLVEDLSHHSNLPNSEYKWLL